MRVICLVPSLTETLIECGVDVVGRTRFCIHPESRVRPIAKVGGTKGVDWQRCKELKADLVVFDREENLKSMAEQCPFPWHATRINSVEDVGSQLIVLGERLNCDELIALGNEWNELAQLPNRMFNGWLNIPGQLEKLNHDRNEYQRIEYLIWRKPWMGIGGNTFIYSMLSKLGFGEYLPEHTVAYPELSSRQLSREDTFYLFSSEPYPFAKHKQQLIDQKFHGAIVDGEVYSWFGVRSYRYLKSYLQ